MTCATGEMVTLYTEERNTRQEPGTEKIMSKSGMQVVLVKSYAALASKIHFLSHMDFFSRDDLRTNFPLPSKSHAQFYGVQSLNNVTSLQVK